VPSEQVRAEAAAWVAQLHDEQRSPHLEARVHAWLGESEDHRRAFNRMTHVWERSGLIQMRRTGRRFHHSHGTSPRVTSRAVTLAATLVVAGIVAVYFWRDDALVTGVGQQQVRLLQDGTRVRASTPTRASK